MKRRSHDGLLTNLHCLIAGESPMGSLTRLMTLGLVME